VVLVDKGNVIVYHRNPATSDLWDAGTKLQKINPANYSNPLANRTFGFAMNGPGFMVSGKSLQSAKDTGHYRCAILSKSKTIDPLKRLVARCHPSSLSGANG